MEKKRDDLIGTPFNLMKGGEGVESVYLHHLTQMQQRDREMLDDHEERLRVLEFERAETDRRFDTLSKIAEEHEKKIDEIKSGFTNNENTMLKEFREMREQNRESRLFLQELIQGSKEAEAAAAESAQETSRTKLQMIRDVSIAILSLMGTIVGGIIAYQEIIVEMIK